MIANIPRPDRCWSQWVPPRIWADRVCCLLIPLPPNYATLAAIEVVSLVTLPILLSPTISLKDYEL